eukprot:1214236-Pleurochrysis_carterae.AAC.2
MPSTVASPPASLGGRGIAGSPLPCPAGRGWAGGGGAQRVRAPRALCPRSLAAPGPSWAAPLSAAAAPLCPTPGRGRAQGAGGVAMVAAKMAAVPAAAPSRSRRHLARRRPCATRRRRARLYRPPSPLRRVPPARGHSAPRSALVGGRGQRGRRGLAGGAPPTSRGP